MGKLDLAHDDQDCQFLHGLKHSVSSIPITPHTDTSSDDEDTPVPLPQPVHPQHDVAVQDDQATPPLPRPRRVTRPPARYSPPPTRYSPSPRERQRKKSLAKFSSKRGGRQSDTARVVPVMVFRGHKYGPLVDETMPDEDDDSSDDDESTGEEDET